MITRFLWKDFIKEELLVEGRITCFTVAFLIYISIFTVVIDIVFSPFELIIYFTTKKLNKSIKERDNK
nr:MAG TPA: hypothetical protein [Caudoviricetes sp.]